MIEFRAPALSPLREKVQDAVYSTEKNTWFSL